jgi:hypothetical protein
MDDRTSGSLLNYLKVSHFAATTVRSSCAENDEFVRHWSLILLSWLELAHWRDRIRAKKGNGIHTGLG